MSSTARSAATRQRLLDAAVQVFAEKGFRSATIGQICRRAGANIAAAHYHFGNKERLYAAVFDYAARAPEEPRAEAANGRPAATRLREHITSFLQRLLDPGRPAWIARLVAHEMIEPTRVLDRLVRERMRANHEQIASAIAELLGPDASPETIRLCTLSVVSQCVFYRNSAPVISRLYPDLVPQREVERIADHVTRFSVAGIRGLRRAGRAGEA
jgi:AcrR family transcriptional regulator